MREKKDNTDYLVIGRLGSSFGVQGWSKVQSYTEPAENITDYDPLYFLIKGEWQELEISDFKCQGNHILIKLKMCDSPEVAKTLTGTSIAIKRNQLKSLNKKEYYWIDLEGCQVFTKENVELGILDYLIETGGHDVMVIKGDKERLIPFLLNHYVLSVDVKAKKIIVDWDPLF